jgi:two-component system cell cycle response regulator
LYSDIKNHNIALYNLVFRPKKVYNNRNPFERRDIYLRKIRENMDRDREEKTAAFNSITLDRLEEHLFFFHKMFDIVRLVNPVNKTVIDYRNGNTDEIDEICYDYWKRGEICDNCISVRAYLANKFFMKLEQTGEAIMVVTAIPLEGTHKPAVLELLKNATDMMMIGNGIYSEGRMVRNLIADLNELIVKDDLTGVYNRRYVNERLPGDIAKAAMEKVHITVIFVDIDNLKEINDTYGHVNGDKAIVNVADAILQSIRTDRDWVARYGGDEFLISLYNATKEDAYKVIERIRSRIAELEPEGEPSVTVSLGIYTMQDTLLTAQELIELADQKLYEAKQSGKNQTAD